MDATVNFSLKVLKTKKSAGPKVVKLCPLGEVAGALLIHVDTVPRTDNVPHIIDRVARILVVRPAPQAAPGESDWGGAERISRTRIRDENVPRR